MEGELGQGCWEGQEDGQGGPHNPWALVKGPEPLALEKNKMHFNDFCSPQDTHVGPGEEWQGHHTK